VVSISIKEGEVSPYGEIENGKQIMENYDDRTRRPQNQIITHLQLSIIHSSEGGKPTQRPHPGIGLVSVYGSDSKAHTASLYAVENI
jgi:hypothetical protein